MRWKQWSLELDRACRLELLRRQYAETMFLANLQAELKAHSRVKRHLKLTTQVRFFKYWKDYVSHRKCLRGLNQTAYLFLIENTRHTLLECFLALRHHKETKKVEIMQSAIHNDVDQSLNRL